MATLKTNTLTGTSTAGSIAVTGEGNSTTTNLQQGLCKCWLNVTDNETNNDSLNVSSHADTAAGRQTIAITNPFGATTTMSTGCSGNETSVDNGSGNFNRTAHFCRGNTTSQAFLNTYNCSVGALEDIGLSSGVIMGDLA